MTRTRAALAGALVLLAFAVPDRAHAAPQVPSLTRQLARFDRDWAAHGIGLVLQRRAHTATITARTYQFCGPGVSQPCDGNGNLYGLRVTVLLTDVQGDLAVGHVLRSTDPSGLPAGAYVGLVLLPYHRLYLDALHYSLGRVLCDWGWFEHHGTDLNPWWTCGA